MPNYIRAYRPGGTFFFTVVTHERRPILTTPEARACLKQAWQLTQKLQPVEQVAYCLLPDHLHVVWSLPEDDADYATRWSRFKAVFTKRYLALGGSGGALSDSMRVRREGGIWQRRFWEHAVRDAKDLEGILEYIHYNPVKHGHVNAPIAWPYSSFRRFVDEGWYAADWGEMEPTAVQGVRDAGEP